jgi:hypothetical protein
LNVLGKATGVLSAVTGGYTMISEGIRAITTIRTDGFTKDAGVAIANSFSGFAAAAGGIMMFTPLAPLAPVAFAVSGIVSAGAWVADNWDRLVDGGKAAVGAIRNAGTIIKVGAQRTVEKVGEAARAVGAAASRAWNSVTNTVRQTAAKVGDSVSSAVSTAANAVSSFFSGLFSKSSP